LRRALAAILLCILLSFQAAAGIRAAQPGANRQNDTGDQQLAFGTVFNDADGDGVRDEGEAGIGDVCVSNGREVVRTTPEGLWSLPVGEDTALFVIKPGHYGVPVNAHQIPQHYYLHKPHGSPALEAVGVAATAPLPASIDFPLHPQEEKDHFTVIFFGDTQARGMREVNFITHDVVEECLETEAAFGVSLGDIVADDPNLFAEISESIGQIGIPWYNVFGNHDYNRAATTDQHSDETFEHFFGPSTYAFEYGCVVFIALKSTMLKAGGGHANRFSEDQIAFVRNYLASVPADRLVVLMMHVPIVACENREDILRLLARRPYTFSIASHAHEQLHLFLGPEQGWRGKEPHHHFITATVSGSWWCGLIDEVGIPHATMNDGAPNGYSLVTFDGNRYSIRFKAARRPSDYQMNIYLPDDIEQARAGQTEILVNVFAGSERSKVEMRFGAEGEWVPLEHALTIDPQCLRMHELSPYLDQTVLGKALEEVFGWKMDYPSESYHIWKGRLPTNPPLGTHTVTVRSTDMFGQTWTGHRIIRIR